jgi:glyoxylase-like metal-dependent hydrolase (beta-lactamase superfamily II)
LTLRELGPGESFADVWWQVTSPAASAAVIGDLAMYGIPPFMQSGHSHDWIRSLEILKSAIPQSTPIYIGHDLQAVGQENPARNHTILDWQLARIHAFRDAVTVITHKDRLLTDREIEAVVNTLNAEAPENLPAFNFLISTSANVLAAELILEQQKLVFEEQLQAVLAAQSE